MTAALGIDAGASSTRWCLLGEDGLELKRGVAPPFTGHLFEAAERETNLACLRAVLSEAAEHADILGVVGGITGLHRNTEAQSVFVAEAARVLNLNPQYCYFDNDLHVLYSGVFAPGEGVVLYAGTGAVAYHETLAGDIETAGGYGYLVDDAGAGFWIGQRALRWLMREHDAHGESESVLARALCEVVDSSWSGIMRYVYAHGRSGVAALVPAVASAAVNGDEVALAILEAAALELADLLKRLQTRLGTSLPVAFAGGVANSEVVVERVGLELAPLPFKVVTIQADRVAAELALTYLG